MHTYVHTFAHTYIHTCMHAYIHTYITYQWIHPKNSSSTYRQQNYPSVLHAYKSNSYLIEEIRKHAKAVEKCNWTIEFTWIKAHAGNYGNEFADKLAKEAARKYDISFNRIPKSEIVQHVRDQSLAKWQTQWNRTTKALKTKEFFPIFKERLNTIIKLTPNFTAIITAHAKTKAYLHRFKITKSPECPCDGGNQTVDHLIYDCPILRREREKLTSKVSKQDNWPLTKSDLVNKFIKHFVQLTNTIFFKKLWTY